MNKIRNTHDAIRNMNTLERIIIAGAGGQGIMLLGKVLAQGAMREGKYVTWLPAYGAEVRGGTAYCIVVISDTEVSSPYVEKADTLIIMNAPSFGRFKARVKNNGIVITNSSLIHQNGVGSANRLAGPFTDIAVELGNIKVANMVALGYYVAVKKIVSKETILSVMHDIAPPDKNALIEINEKALEEGMRLK